MLLYTQFAAALVGLVLVGLSPANGCGCCCCKKGAQAPAPAPSVQPAKPANGTAEVKTRQVTLSVSGMSCASCAAKVQQALASVPGVRQVQVDLKKEQAVVTVEADKCDEPALLKALEKAGYGGKVLK